MKPHEDPAFMNYAQAAHALGVCKRTLNTLARAGALPFPDGYGRFPTSAVQALADKWNAERRARLARDA
jgi:hypothetical protein